jgi:hypothetical protein
MIKHLAKMVYVVGVLCVTGAVAHNSAYAQDPIKIFISVDMEGISGIGTPKLTSGTGKDYGLGRPPT